jgi:hypothetical protein
MGISAGATLLLGTAIVCYLAAVVIALPLGITGVVDQNYSLIPLGLGAVAMAAGIIAETHTGGPLSRS